jgi:hypothetical protein
MSTDRPHGDAADTPDVVEVIEVAGTAELVDDADAAPDVAEAAPTGEREPGGPLGLAALGALFEVGDRLRTVGSASQRVWGGLVRPAQWLLEQPVAQPIVRYSNDQLARLSERGRAELESTAEQGIEVVRQQATRITQSAVVPEVVDDVAAPLVGPVLDAALPVAFDRLSRDPDALLVVVDRVLDAVLPQVIEKLAQEPELLEKVVDSLLGSVIDRALPEVFDTLGRDPDALVDALAPVIDRMLEQMLPVVLARLGDQSESLRALIAEQSGSLATDLANEMRSRVVTGDELVERVLVRTRVRRRPKAERKEDRSP